MALVAAKCTQCGANLQIEDKFDATICPCCGTPFITEKAIKNYITNNNTYNTTNSTTNVTKNMDIKAENVYMADEREFVIVGGVLKEYRGESTKVVIPEGVIEIGYQAFKGLSEYVEIVFPQSLKKIGRNAFEGCECNTLTIPQGVTSIAEKAFQYSKIESIVIPDSVTSIGDYAFENCSSLTSVTIPDSVTSIGDYAFENCSNLTSITIPDSVTSIGESAFSGCSNLTSMIVGENVKGIGKQAFDGCKKLKDIENNSMLPVISFDGTPWCLDKMKEKARERQMVLQAIREQREQEIQRQRWEKQEIQKRIASNQCQYCGGNFKGLFRKVCSNCGKEKDY